MLSPRAVHDFAVLINAMRLGQREASTVPLVLLCNSDQVDAQQAEHLG